MCEPETQSVVPECIKFVRVDITDHGQMMLAGLQVLSEGQQVTMVIDEIAHHSAHFGYFFPESEHESRFCGYWIV